MSISTPHGGGNRRPSSIKPGGKPKDAPTDKSGSTAPKSGSASSGSASSGSASSGSGKAAGATKGTRPAAGGKGGGRRPVTPVKANQGRNWGPIGMFAAVGVIALGIVGFGAYQVHQNGMSWEDRAAKISGIQNFRKSNPNMLKYEKHQPGKISYPMAPPVGGAHNDNWQRCLGDVYTAPIANEHAVHSMEHGAVWITYKPDLPKAQVDELAKKVKGHDYTLMSPDPAQSSPISVQTWGYQLKVDNAGDSRIDDFITALREVSSMEQGATCSSGSYITETGTAPRDLAPAPATGGGQPGGIPGGQPGGIPGGQPGGIPGGQPGGIPGGQPGGIPGGQPGGIPGGTG